MPTILKTLGMLALCYAAITAWVYFSQRRMLYQPRHEIRITPADAGLEYQDVHLTNELGTRIHGWWVPCENARFTLLFSHGNGGNVSHRVESLRIFHDLGLSVLVYDYSGYGMSEGKPSETATEADALAAWDWLTAEQDIAPQSVILLGRSLGGGVSAGLAKTLTKNGTSPAGLILESTFTSIPDMGALLYPWLPVRLLAKYRYETKADIAEVDIPILFAHSPEDDIIPYALGIELFESYRGPKSFLELTGDHNTGFILSGEKYPQGIGKFLTGLEQGR
ncbi:alpha/beta hydrolase [uncultured Pseudodesulfovibrio sp.]|uniref:alpha/beta hydrolase n=1 Tax=uncultured Pseudodesulfovibrio sp. TaxID=2035858 RepID=UPI0029C6B4C8|nr:alpha/beta hydrolase [uncultured Pseudodesulfovibrio sp.]